MYGGNPFPELVHVARFVNQFAEPSDRLLVFGSEPEVYFYTGVPAATKYIYMYPLFERHPYADQMQQEMIEQIEQARPEFCVALNVGKSWLPPTDAPNDVFNWWTHYRHAHYQRIGVVDIQSVQNTVYIWGDYARVYQPQSNIWIGVYRRRDMAARPGMP
jgi:hypothetical protein